MVQMIYVQSKNRDTGVENKCMDTKGGGRWDELGDWDCPYIHY